MIIDSGLRARALALFTAIAFIGCTCGAPADTTPPTFDGVSGVAVVDDHTLQLSWASATDDLTPPEGLTYLVHQGLAADAIELSTPLATTAPGATTVEVGGLAPGTTYYFIVRAQDAAGNTDANETVASGATTFGGRPPARQLGSFTLTGTIHRAVTSGNRMYLALGGAGIEVDDITDPPKPIRLSTLALAESADDAAIEPVRQLLYVADGTKGLTIVDVQDSAAPRLQATYDPGLAGAAATAVAATTEHAYLASGSKLFVVDVEAPTAPDFVAELAMPAAVLTLAVEGATLYALHQGGALTAWDISEPGPKLLSTFAGPADGKALAVDAQVAYVASPSSGVLMVSFAAPGSPAPVGTVGTSAAAVAVEGNTVALAGSSAFYSYDVTDKVSPQLLTGNPVVTTPDVVGVSRGLGIYIYRAGPRAPDTSASQGVILNIPPYAWYASPGARSSVPANTPVYFYFSKPMDPASLTAGSLVVRDGAGTVAGAATFDWSNTRLLFTPAAALSPLTTYTVALSAELADTRGDKLWPTTGVTYSFTTAPPVPPPSTPAWLSAIPGDRYVRLSWPWVSGAASYVVYWSTAPGVTAASNRSVTWGTSWYHSGLTNAQPYYYRVAAVSAVGESALSAEVSATPIPPPVPQPVPGLWATPANQKVTLSWSSVSGATRYNVYWSTTPNAPLAARTRVATVSRPFAHAPLTNGQPYYYVVTAENATGESAPSYEVTATPYAPPTPAQVTGLWAQGGDTRVTLQWNWASGAGWYNVYAGTAPGQARTLPRVARVWGTSFTHWGLTNGQPYFYVVVAENDGGPGPDSVEVSALPVAPPLPAPPTNVMASGGDRRATVYWTGAQYATRYNLYWSTTPGVTRATGQKVSWVRNPFTHQGLVNGASYYYVVTAENSAGESAESDEVVASPLPPPIPTAPQNLTATAQDKAVSLRWAYVPGASSYTIYFSTSPSVDRATAGRLYTGYAGYTHRYLTNGLTYYYLVTASNSGGESLPSSEVSATPVAPPAPTAAPLNLTGSAGDARNYVWWSYASGASWYNVYWSTSPGVTTASNKAARVWPTWGHWSLANGTTYYYRVSAENSGGEGPLSAEISLTPQLPAPPSAPTGFAVAPRDRSNSLSWNYAAGATWYDVYWSTAPGVTRASARIRVSYSRGYTHYGLTNGQQYCYAVVAGNNGGESALTAEVCGTPAPPPAPTGAPTLTVTGLDSSARLSWTGVSGASLYYVYFKLGAGVTPQNGTRLGVGTWGPYTHWGLTNGSEYCYVATAVNSGGEGPASGEVCVTPAAPPPPGTPTNLSATPLNAQVRINFTGVSGALQYNLYWSTQPGVTPATGVRVGGVYSGWVHSGLTNGTPYHYVLTALNSAGESAATAQVSATPFVPAVPAAPGNVVATAGNAQNTVSWSASQGATSYALYWSTQPGVTKQTGTRVNFAQSPYTHSGLANGTTYYYVVTATNANGESADSAQAQATPTLAAPQPPAQVQASAGNGQATLSWSQVSGATSYNLYWSTQTGVTRQTGTKISGVSSGYVHTGLTNGTPYYWVVTAQNAGGESAESAQVTATPAAAGLPAPTWVSVVPSNGQVTLSWNPVSGATSYNLYWATGTTVTKLTGTKLTGVTSPYVHTGRTNGTAYAYVVTAQDASGESAESTVVSATPVSLPAPTTFSVNPGYRTVALQIVAGTSGVRAYNVYWSTSSGVTPQTGTRLTSTSASWAHQGLATGVTYYYVATYTTDAGESAPTTQRIATTTQPPATTLTATAGSASVSLSASAGNGAFSRVIYWSTTTPVNKQTANVITLTQTSYGHTGLTNGTPYYYLASFTYPEGTFDSAETSATPQPVAASTPNLYAPVAGYRQVTVSWNSATSALSYNLYWSTAPGVTTASNVIAISTGGTWGSFVHAGLTTAQPYYYRVEGVFASGPSALSAEYSAAPNLPAPSLTLQPSHQQNRLSWADRPGATSYNLYWRTTTGVTKANGTPITGATSTYAHPGLTNGTTYYYVATAVYPDGESADSGQIAGVPLVPVPTGVTASGGSSLVSLTWSPTVGASAYNVYWSTSSTVSKSTGTKVAGVNSPWTHTGLSYGARYYYVVTAEYGGTESADSAVVDAYAQLRPPGYLSANGGFSSANLYWGASPSATGYNVYWSNSASVSPSTGTKIALPASSTTYTHAGLPNGVGVYYVVTATDGVNETAPTTAAFALPSLGTAPYLAARGGDQAVGLGFGSSSNWAVYWSTSPTVSVATGTRVPVSGIAWTHTGLTNGTPYYYVLTQVGPLGDEGPPSYVASVTPGLRVPTALVSRVDPTAATLAIETQPGVTRYNVYYGTSPGVTKASGTPVNDVFVNVFAFGAMATQFTWEHSGLSAGTTYYWVVTAVGPSGESAESAEISARPRAGPANVAATVSSSGVVTLTWDAVVGASGYRVYCSATPNARNSNVCTTSATNQATYAFQEYLDLRQFQVTALDGTLESGPSPDVLAVWYKTAPAAPTLQPAAAGDGQAVLSWTVTPPSYESNGNRAQTYDLYYGTAAGVTKGNGTRVANVTSQYVHTGLANGTPYYYVLAAVNPAGESVISNEVSVTPTAGAAGNWTSVGAEVARGAVVTSPALAVRGTAPYVLLGLNDARGRSRLRVRTFGGSAWADLGGELNQDADSTTFQHRIAQDASNVYALYSETTGVARRLEVIVQRHDGSGWTRMGTTFNTRIGVAFDLDLIGGTPHVLYAEQSATGELQLFARAWSGSAWTLVGGALNTSGQSVAAAQLGAQGTEPLAAFLEGPLGGSTRTARVLRYTGGAWGALTLPTPASGQVPSAVAVATSGQNLYVALTGTAGGRSVLEVFASTGGAFTQLGGVLNSTAGNAEAASIELIGGAVHASFVEPDPGSGVKTVWVKRWTGAAWSAALGGASRYSPVMPPVAVSNLAEGSAQGWVFFTEAQANVNASTTGFVRRYLP